MKLYILHSRDELLQINYLIFFHNAGLFGDVIICSIRKKMLTSSIFSAILDIFLSHCIEYDRE